MTRTVTRSPGETVALGREFAARVVPGAVIALHGTLGSGKTCFALGVCLGLGATGNISSPTFTIINEYPAPFGLVAHADLYRIRTAEELADVGLEEYFRGDCVTLIEWPEAAEGILPPETLVVRCEHGASDAERVFDLPEGAGGAG